MWCVVYDRENISGWDWTTTATTTTIVAVCHDSKAACVCLGIASYVRTIIHVYYTTFRKYFYMNFGWLFSVWVEWRMTTLLLRATKTKFIAIIFRFSFSPSIVYMLVLRLWAFSPFSTGRSRCHTHITGTNAIEKRKKKKVRNSNRIFGHLSKSTYR